MKSKSPDTLWAFFCININELDVKLSYYIQYGTGKALGSPYARHGLG